MDMSPWLAGVFVAPSHRRQGIGRALVWRGLEEARNLGLRRLYLYTPNSEGFYSNLGWLAIERTTYRDVNVVIMSYDI
jgi:predicted N-acetyltransferase YhbS